MKVLCSVAAFSTLIALVLQDHSLSTDLRGAAHTRLARAAGLAHELLDDHLSELIKRFRAISGTPQFIANLEAGHTQTLIHYADELATRHRATGVVFTTPEREPIAFAGSTFLGAKALDCLDTAPRLANPPVESSNSAVFEENGRLYATADVPLHIEGKHVGNLVVLEQITDDKLAYVSRLCGAEISIAGTSDGDLSMPVQPRGEVELTASVSMDAERAALSNSRKTLLAAGLAALLLAFVLSLLVTRGVTRPILAIQRAAERIGRGDIEFRLRAHRNDEVGDVARAFDVMLDRLEQTQGRLTNAQRLARLANWQIDAGSGEVTGSEEFWRIYGLDEADLPIDTQTLISRVHPDDRRAFRDGIAKCLAHGQIMRLDHRVLAVDGSEQVLQTFAERVADGQLEGSVQDITDRKQIENQIRYLAYHDSLTGLGNRRLLKERLGVALENTRHTTGSVAVLSLDVDRFNAINDSLGHSAGDELLMEVAGRLTSSVRVSGRSLSFDQPDRASLVTRFGGDEFTVLLTDVDNRGDVDGLAREILDSFCDPFHVVGQDIVVNASIGIAFAPADADDVDTLLRNSDVAMSHAKSLGAGRYQFYTDAMQVRAAKRLELENKMRRAIQNGEFELLYQPKQDAHTGLVHGVEALIRWNDPEAGRIAPDEFLPLAEETGLIVEIGEWVLRTAMTQAVEWQQQGWPLRVAVNVSVQQMEDRLVFLQTVTRLLEETGLDPQRLDLEITESTLMRDEAQAITLLQKLRDIGLGLSLDDFGTGYSSLSHLRKLPIDTLKIDRSFVQRIESDPRGSALVGSIIGMAKVLGLKVVVEGVETTEQRELLVDLGCDEIQGFLFSRPLPAAEIPALMSANGQSPAPEPALA